MTLLILAAALVVAAPQLKPPPASANPHIGRWATESLTVNGKSNPQDKSLEYEFTKDGQWIIYRDGKILDCQSRTYKADLTPKLAAIDLNENGGTMPGIFEVKGDVLTLNFRTDRGKARPTGFDDTQDTMVFVMKRVPSK